MGGILVGLPGGHLADYLGGHLVDRLGDHLGGLQGDHLGVGNPAGGGSEPHRQGEVGVADLK